VLLAHDVPVDETAPGATRRRVLQLFLAGLWLLDGVLQLQVFMFSRGFADSVADAAGGNPALISWPVSWTSRLIGAHGALATIGIAIIEVLLGLGIAWRPTVRHALAASVAWAIGVWWLGEGLGGLLTPDANLVAGAPGAAIIYALLAIVLWPPGQQARRQAAPADAAPSDNAGADGLTIAGRPAARVLWLLLWGGLALLSAWQAVAAPQALQRALAGLADGQPRWLAAADAGLAASLAHHGAQVGLLLGAVLAVIAAAVFFPVPARRALLAVAAMLAAALWTVGQGFGGMLTGMATDPNSGPLLLLAVAAYWPARTVATASAGQQAGDARRRGDGLAMNGALPWVRRDIDVMNVLMAIAMASMLAGRLSPVLEMVWLVTFAAASAWFAGHAVRVWLRRAAPGQHVMHLLSCGGMLVMLAAPRAGAGAISMTAAGARPAVLVPTLAAAFAVAMAGSVVVLTDRLPEVGRAPHAVRPAGKPPLRVSCQMALGIAMACMLIQML
jgi:hypothetical protein